LTTRLDLAEDATTPSCLTLGSPGRISPIFASALLGACLLHVLAIMTLSFEPSKPKGPPETTLEVLILKESGRYTPQPPSNAALSQRNRLGDSPSGNAAAASPPDLAPAEQAPPEPETPDEPIVDGATEDIPPTLATRLPAPPTGIAKETDTHPPLREELSVLSANSRQHSRPQPLDMARPSRPPVDAARILASSSEEIARLTASLEQKTTAYANRVRRKSVSASTREFRYANYLGAWARKVERIGNLNYPQAAKDNRLYGSLILDVAVRSDGSVERIRIVRSSGYDLLDESAIQIVELAAPYSPFPPDIAAETDVLNIVRTWQFTRGGILGWER
jgi:periplasmic protein TonB